MAMPATPTLVRLISITYLCLLFVYGQDDACSVSDRVCGLNGICQVVQSLATCSCPPGFEFVELANPFKGCTQKASQQISCNATNRGVRMEKVDNIDWPGNDFEHMVPVNESACQQACLKDCFCIVSIYANIENIDNCWKKAMPLLNGGQSQSRTAFIKVSTANETKEGEDGGEGQGEGGGEGEGQKEGEGKRKSKGNVVVAVVITLAGCFSVFAAILLLIWLLGCPVSKVEVAEKKEEFTCEGLKAFSYQEMDAATGGFQHELGSGSFGKVYKGMLSDGRAIAVKKLEKVGHEGEWNGEKEFRTEMSVIGASHHKNLVQLYGFCGEGSHRILVYEYMSKGSLDKLLFKGIDYLDWDLRVQIVLGTATGILYLHEECRTQILHCDIKPQNILLDQNYTPKISDFGMAKFIKAEQTRTFTVARGTMGYIAPEWQTNMAITVKVDVYSFGVMLLEIICYRKMVELDLSEKENNLTNWVYECLQHGRLEKLVELQQPKERNQINFRQLERMVLVGLWCIQEDPSLRPSIKKVVQMLEGTVEIAVPPCPASYQTLETTMPLRPNGGS